MTLIGTLVQDPGMETKKWMFPTLWRIIYFIGIAVTVLMTLVKYVVMMIAPFCDSHLKLHEALGIAALYSLILIIALVMELVIARVIYEGGILLFRIFESQRETIAAISKTNELLEKTRETQLKCGQYICDCLATICDKLNEE